MPFADSQGCRIFYRLEGSPAKPLLVLVHSLGADHGMWDPQMPAMLGYFQVLRLDLRGHGASDAPAGEYTIPTLAADVLSATGGGTKFSYCGLSLGGMIGMWLAANHGDRIERLVLANTSPRMSDPAMMEQRRRAVLADGMTAIEEAVLARFFSPRTLAAEPAAESVRTVLLSTNPRGYAGCCAAIRDMDNRPLLERITVPTLVIGSDADPSTPWEGHGDLLVRGIAGAQAAKLDGAHLSNIERPAGFTAALLGFLLPELGPEAAEAMRRAVLGEAHVDGRPSGLGRDSIRKRDAC